MVAKTALRRFGRSTTGATAVEAALLFPLAFAMIYGLLEFGRMMISRQEVSRLTELLSRQAIVASADLKTLDPQTAKNDYGLMLDAEKLDIAVSEELSLQFGERFHIKVRYTFDFLVSFDGLLKLYNPDMQLGTQVIENDAYVPKLAF